MVSFSVFFLLALARSPLLSMSLMVRGSETVFRASAKKHYPCFIRVVDPIAGETQRCRDTHVLTGCAPHRLMITILVSCVRLPEPH